jgi:predicted dehydrogenase
LKLQPNKQNQLRLGIVGLPAVWDKLYRPALATLSNRVQVTTVFNATGDRALLEAERLDAVPVSGVLALARRTEVDAVLVLDTGWTKHNLLPHLATISKPVFLGTDALDLETVEYLHSIVTLNGATWTPELSHRFSPATIRLMELMATQLGDTLRIEMVVPATDASWTRTELAKAIDWAFFVLRTASSVQSVRIDQSGCRLRCNIAGGRTADVVMMNARDDEEPHRIVKCGRGEATITSDQTIQWQITGHTPTVETLSGESDAIGMQLAIFLRRAVGGLIPAADLSDLHRCHVAAERISTAWF